MYEQVNTGPLYGKMVQLMITYRSVAARMENARSTTQGKLDRRLERLSERISEGLSELTDQERSALDCWREGKMRGTYEVDHEGITAKPYVSIRVIRRWNEVYETKVADVQEDDPVRDPKNSQLLETFLKLDEDV